MSLILEYRWINGVLRAWVDGELAFEETGVHLGDLPNAEDRERLDE